MSLVLGCCREIISNGPTRFHQGGDVVSNNKRSLMMISSSIEKQNNNTNHLSCFSVDPTDFSSSSSSIGGDSDDDFDDDDDEFTSSKSKFTMDSLEESLPIKRGLSNFFSGRSKSFANLSEATTVRSLAKTENPFNKRRRTLMACKMSRNRRKSFYTSSTKIISPVSMPILKLNEDESDDDEDDQSETDDDEQQIRLNKNNTNINDKDEDDEKVELTEIQHQQHGRIKRFKAPRCFSLTDLHHHQHQ